MSDYTLYLIEKFYRTLLMLYSKISDKKFTEILNRLTDVLKEETDKISI